MDEAAPLYVSKTPRPRVGELRRGIRRDVRLMGFVAARALWKSKGVAPAAFGQFAKGMTDVPGVFDGDPTSKDGASAGSPTVQLVIRIDAEHMAPTALEMLLRGLADVAQSAQKIAAMERRA